MKISHYPNQPHCFAFGGFDMQMLNVINSVNSIGVDISIDVDIKFCLFCFSLSLRHFVKNIFHIDVILLITLILY